MRCGERGSFCGGGVGGGTGVRSAIRTARLSPRERWAIESDGLSRVPKLLAVVVAVAELPTSIRVSTASPFTPQLHKVVELIRGF